MKRYIHILLAGLAAAGLASCDKQDLKLSSDKDIYSIVFVADEGDTKASTSIVVGESHRFHATLKKNGTPVDCNDWTWNPEAVVNSKQQGSETYKGVKSGYIDVVGAAVGSGLITATTNTSNTGGVKVEGYKAVDVTARPNTVTFNFNSDIESLVTRNVDASQTQKWVNASQSIVIWDKGSTSNGGTAFVDFFSYTGWILTEVKSQFNSSTKDTRVLKTSWETTSKTIYVGIANSSSYVEVYEGEQGGGSPALKWSGTPSVSLSAGSSTTPGNYPTGYNASKFKAVYEITVTSDMTVSVTIN